MLEVTRVNEKVDKWPDAEYTDYNYDGRLFIVSKGGRTVGIYNLDHVVSIILKE